ncbi:MAG: hypothetical protein ACLFNQ_09240 [Spirochaetaceae bacterium]
MRKMPVCRYHSVSLRTATLLRISVVCMILVLASCESPASPNTSDATDSETPDGASPDQEADPAPTARVVAWEPASADGVWKGWSELTIDSGQWSGTLELISSGDTRFHVHAFGEEGELSAVGYAGYEVLDIEDPVMHEFAIEEADLTAVTMYSGSVQGRTLDLTGYANAIAGTGGSSGFTDGTFQDGTRFNKPYGITTDGMHIFIADYENHTIRRMEIATGQVVTLAGSAGQAFFIDDETGTEARFEYPRGITYHDGVLYVTDGLRDEGPGTRVRTVDPDSGATGTLIDVGSAIIEPVGIAAAAGNLYITDFYGNSVYRYDPMTGTAVLFAGRVSNSGTGGIGGASGGDGTGSDAIFVNPWGIVSDGTYLYVADANDNAVRRVDPITAEVTTIIRTDTQAYLSNPTGITTDGERLYVSDTGNNRIREIRLDENREFDSITDLAGQKGTAGTNWGIGSIASFGAPIGITTDGINIYIADRQYHLVRKIQ